MLLRGGGFGMPDGSCMRASVSDETTVLRVARGIAYIPRVVTTAISDPQSHEMPLHAPLPVAGGRKRLAMPSPRTLPPGDVATPRSSCVRRMLRPLLAAPTYNEARRRAIYQRSESCMTGAPRREPRRSRIRNCLRECSVRPWGRARARGVRDDNRRAACCKTKLRWWVTRAGRT